MIYDPFDVNMCMNELGVLFYRQAPAEDGKATTLWVELNEMKRNGSFRRPEW